MEICERCGTQAGGTIMSKFNQQTICFECKDEETQAPGYRRADAAELAAVQRWIDAGHPKELGNFPGVGLEAEDCAFLCAAIARRPGWTGSGRDVRLPIGDTTDATLLLRLRVNYTMDTPSLGDAVLLNAALHLEGREVTARSVQP